MLSACAVRVRVESRLVVGRQHRPALAEVRDHAIEHAGPPTRVLLGLQIVGIDAAEQRRERELR